MVDARVDAVKDVAGKLTERVAAFVKKERLPGAAAGVVVDDTLAWTTGYGYAHNLDPALVEKIKQSFFTFPWDGSALKAEFKNEDRFVPISYKKDWSVIRKVDAANGVIEIGNIYWGPVMSRKPAATEAQFLFMQYAFDKLGYRRYEWKCNALNAPSRRAALRFGFTFEGIFRQHMIVKDRNRDTAWFSMLDSEWPARKASFERWLDAANFGPDGRQKISLSALNRADGE